MRAGWILVVGLIACGGGAKERAQSTIQLTSRALVDVEHSGGESPAFREAVQAAHDWLDPVEAAVDIWAEGGDAAYRRVVGCLGNALADVRDALVAEQREVPTALEQAEAETRGASDTPCSGGSSSSSSE